MARAFSITVNSKYDLRPIKKYGDVMYLYTDMQHPPINNPQRMLDDCIERLENFGFDPKVDFIIMTGAVVNVALFVAAAFVQYGTLKLLMYDPRTNKYYERQIEEDSELPETGGRSAAIDA